MLTMRLSKVLKCSHQLTCFHRKECLQFCHINILFVFERSSVCAALAKKGPANEFTGEQRVLYTWDKTEAIAPSHRFILTFT